MSEDWREVRTLDELEDFLRIVGRFHDGVIKEVHWVNNDHVNGSLCMLPERLAQVRMLVQRQWKNPSAVEIVFDDVRRMHLDWEFIFSSTASVEKAPTITPDAGSSLLVLNMELNEVVFS